MSSSSSVPLPVEIGNWSARIHLQLRIVMLSSLGPARLLAIISVVLCSGFPISAAVAEGATALTNPNTSTVIWLAAANAETTPPAEYLVQLLSADYGQARNEFEKKDALDKFRSEMPDELAAAAAIKDLTLDCRGSGPPYNFERHGFKIDAVEYFPVVDNERVSRASTVRVNFEPALDFVRLEEAAARVAREDLNHVFVRVHGRPARTADGKSLRVAVSFYEFMHGDQVVATESADDIAKRAAQRQAQFTAVGSLDDQVRAQSGLPAGDTAPIAPRQSTSPAGVLHVFIAAFPRADPKRQLGGDATITAEEALQEVERLRSAGAVIYEAYGLNGQNWRMDRFENGGKPVVIGKAHVHLGRGVGIEFLVPGPRNRSNPNPEVQYRAVRRYGTPMPIAPTEYDLDHEQRMGSFQLPSGQASRITITHTHTNRQSLQRYRSDDVAIFVVRSATNAP